MKKSVYAGRLRIGLLIAVQERRPGGWARGSGAALGLALWVSAETQTVFYLLVLVLFVQCSLAALLPDRDETDEPARCSWRIAAHWSSAALGVGVLGHLAEHRGDVLAFHWDVISTFQLYQLAVFALFAWLDRRPRFAGFYTGLLFVLYGPSRFLGDFLRHPDVDARYLGWTPAQYASLALLAIGVWILVTRRESPPVRPAGTRIHS